MKAEGRRLILVHLLLLVLLYEIMFVPNQRTTVRDYDALLVGIAVIEALFLFALWYCKRRGTLSTGPFDIILAVWLLMIVWELTTSVLNVAHPVLVPCPENVFDTFRKQWSLLLLNVGYSMAVSYTHLIRIASYIVVIAGFVTMVDLLLQAYLPSLSESLGVFIPLIVVNCIILGRAEAFASKHGVLESAADGLCQGIGYTAALVIMCIIREFLGSGTFGAGVISADGVRILPEAYPALMMILPVGGFLTLACLIAFSQWLTKKLEAREAKKEVQA